MGSTNTRLPPSSVSMAYRGVSRLGASVTPFRYSISSLSPSIPSLGPSISSLGSSITHLLPSVPQLVSLGWRAPYVADPDASILTLSVSMAYRRGNGP